MNKVLALQAIGEPVVALGLAPLSSLWSSNCCNKEL
jgi:hypothetical protein